ncbi:MAG: hypothetical protein AAF548_05320 [Actinomycetota bacterium]
MSLYTCIVQEEGRAAEITDALEAGLRRIGVDHLGDTEPASIRWERVPPGFMFTEGEPSTSSVIIRAVPGDITLDAREALMRDICDLWTGETGCTDHEIVVSVFAGM